MTLALASSLGPVAAALLVSISIAGLLTAAFYPWVSGGSAARRRFEAIAAVSQIAPEAGSAALEETQRRRSVEAALRDIEDKKKKTRRKKPALVARMRQAGLGWSRGTYYAVSVGAGAVFALVALVSLPFGLLPALGIGAATGFLLPRMYVGFRLKRRFKRFSNEFPNAVDVIVRGVKAGLPLADCLRIIASEAQEPVRSEFLSIVEDQTLGMPVSEAVQRLPERVPLPEANFFAIVISIQSRTGGSLSEALGNLSHVLRERKKMRGKIKAMSSEAKASGGIIGMLPVVVGILVYLTSPDYISLLFTTTVGNIAIAGSALWMMAGIFAMRKMISFDF